MSSSSSPGSVTIPRNTAPTNSVSTAPVSDKGYEYVVKSGDTLSAIITAYRENGVKVSLKQVLDANEGLKPENLKVGQKIFIPDPNK